MSIHALCARVVNLFPQEEPELLAGEILMESCLLALVLESGRLEDPYWWRELLEVISSAKSCVGTAYVDRPFLKEIEETLAELESFAEARAGDAEMRLEFPDYGVAPTWEVPSGYTRLKEAVQLRRSAIDMSTIQSGERGVEKHIVSQISLRRVIGDLTQRMVVSLDEQRGITN